MFFGLPVISSNVGVAHYALRNESGIIFEIEDVQELINIFNRLIPDESYRLIMGKKAANRSRLLFDYENIVKDLDAILKYIHN